MEDELKRLKSKLVKSNNQKKELDNKIAQLENEKTQLESFVREHRSKQQELEAAKSSLEKKLSDVEEQLQSAMGDAEKARKQGGASSSQDLEKVKKELLEQKDAFNKLTVKHKKLLQQVSTLN